MITPENLNINKAFTLFHVVEKRKKKKEKRGGKVQTDINLHRQTQVTNKSCTCFYIVSPTLQEDQEKLITFNTPTGSHFNWIPAQNYELNKGTSKADVHSRIHSCCTWWVWQVGPGEPEAGCKVKVSTKKKKIFEEQEPETHLTPKWSAPPTFIPPTQPALDTVMESCFFVFFLFFVISPPLRPLEKSLMPRWLFSFP